MKIKPIEPARPRVWYKERPANGNRPAPVEAVEPMIEFRVNGELVDVVI